MRRAALTCALVIACQADADPPPSSIDEADAPARLAAAICRAEHDCSCPDPPWPDRDTCRAVEAQRMEDAAMIAAEHGLAYDGQCVAQIVAAYADAGCEPERTLPPCALACRAYHGAAGEGQPCERLAITVDIDTCDRDLRCESGVCVPRCDPSPFLEKGDRCAAGVQILGTCGPDLVCATETSTCTAAPEIGEPCPDRACVAAGWCTPGADPICMARVGEGEACTVDFHCESNRCDEGACAPMAAAACSFRAG